jgi:hypothetical protein
MKMNKYLQSLLLLGVILLFEAVPFLYNDAYTIRDMKWGWIVGFPIVLLVANSFRGDKEKE